MSNHKFSLTFKIDGIDERTVIKTVEEVFALFPLDDVREFTAKGWTSDENRYCGMFRKMKDLSHLRLEKISYPSSVFGALSGRDYCTSKIVTRTTLIHLCA